MVKQPKGFELDGVYEHPSSILVEHPELLLIVGGFGIAVALLSSPICAGSIYTSRCAGVLEMLGFGIAAVGLTPYVFVRYRRLASGTG